MTDDEINAIVLDFLEARGGYVAGASERELCWMLKNAQAAQRERIKEEILTIRAEYPEDVFPGATGDLARFICNRILAAIRQQHPPSPDISE